MQIAVNPAYSSGDYESKHEVMDIYEINKWLEKHPRAVIDDIQYSGYFVHPVHGDILYPVAYILYHEPIDATVDSD